MELTAEAIRALAIDYGLQVLGALAILLVGWWVASRLVEGTGRLLGRKGVDATLINFLSKAVYYLLLVLVLITALSQLGIPTTSVIAVLGGAALALGLALQDSLGNLAAGVLLIWLRLYKVGDYVEVNEVGGYVTEIGLFHTGLLTLDNKDIFIPNGDVMSGNIINFSRRDLVRLELEYEISYEDDLAAAKRLLEEIMAAEPRVAREPKGIAAVKAMGESGVLLVGRPYVHVPEIAAVTFAINEQVKLGFEAAGISFPFPQREVRLVRASAEESR
jgi:small conductance mechanosensitive channel